MTQNQKHSNQTIKPELKEKIIEQEIKKQHYCYLRISTANQTGGLMSQLRSIENYYERNGITDYKIYKDENVSGAKETRPALDKMMDDIKAGKCEQLVVFAFSRLSRSCAHLLRCLEVFEKHNTRFVSITESVDTSTAFGRTLVALTGQKTPLLLS